MRMAWVNENWSTRQLFRSIDMAVVLGLLLVGSVCINAAMAWRIWGQKSANNQADPAAIGISLSAVACQDMDGNSASIPIGRSSQPIVLYVISPTCVWCARNLENIRALSMSRSSEFQFAGISVSDPDLKSFAASLELSFPIYSIHSYRDIKEIWLGNTPQTFVVSRDGKILKNWIGAYSGETGAAIESYFKVKLPGLPDVIH